VWEALADCNISLREEVWAHSTALTPSLVIEEYEASRDIERSCVCVFGVLRIVSGSMIGLFWWCVVFHLVCDDGCLINSVVMFLHFYLFTRKHRPKLTRLVKKSPL